MADVYFALAVWSDVHDRWACLAVSRRRELLEGLSDQLSSLVRNLHCCVVEVVADDDGVIATVLGSLALPEFSSDELFLSTMTDPDGYF